MKLDELGKTLEASGTQVDLLAAGDSRALVLKRLPAGAHLEGAEGEGDLWIVEGDIRELLNPGARVIGTGKLTVGDSTMGVSRVVTPSLRGLGVKIGEGSGNLARRSEWFGKRRRQTGS